MTSRLVLALAACALLPSRVAADPLLTPAQIAKAAEEIGACLDEQGKAPGGTGHARKCIGVVKRECDDHISAGGDAAHATCSDNETAAWDVLLNRAWAELPEDLGARAIRRAEGHPEAVAGLPRCQVCLPERSGTRQRLGPGARSRLPHG